MMQWCVVVPELVSERSKGNIMTSEDVICKKSVVYHSKPGGWWIVGVTQTIGRDTT